MSVRPKLLPHGAFAQARQTPRDGLLFRLCSMSIPRTQLPTTFAVLTALHVCTLAGSGALSIDTKMQQRSLAVDCSRSRTALGNRGGWVSYAEVVP